MTNQLIIITSEQFGYYTDAIYYVKYLSRQYDITYVCWDHNMDKVDSPHANIVYVSRTGGPIRLIRFTKEILKNIASPKTVLFIKYTKLISSLCRIFLWKNPIILDIRTSCISTSLVKRFFGNLCLTWESKLFSNITVINDELAKSLGVKKNYTILPIGAEQLSNTRKTFDELNLLYVGTLYNRELENLIIGFSKFYHEYNKTCPIHLTIIGDGKSNEIQRLKDESQKLELDNVVQILGWVPHDKLSLYFDTQNIGVSWIPVTDYYDIQPATKTYEYLFAGLPVLATATSANKQMINKSNGVIIGDTPNDLYLGLVTLYRERANFNSDAIKATALSHTWENITHTLSQYIDSIVALNTKDTAI